MDNIILKNTEALYEFLALHKSINFLAIVVTPWHLLSAESYFEKLKREKKDCKALFIISSVNGNYFLTPNDSYFYDSKNAYFVYLRTSQSAKEVLRCLIKKPALKLQNNETVYILKAGVAWHPSMEWYPNSISVNIIDGLSAYLLSDFEWICEFASGKPFFYRILYIFLCFLFFGLKKITFQQTARLNEYFLLDKKTYTPDQTVIMQYREIMMKKSIKLAVKNKNQYHNCILINTQPLSEDGIYADEDIMYILNRLNSILQKYSYRIVIKPHPREENLIKYSFFQHSFIDTENAQLAQELLLSSLTNYPKLVIGFYSTTLVSCKLFFDIPAISLCNMLGKPQNKSEHRIMKKKMNNFKKAFSKLIYIPEDFNDIENYLNTILSKGVQNV